MTEDLRQDVTLLAQVLDQLIEVLAATMTDEGPPMTTEAEAYLRDLLRTRFRHVQSSWRDGGNWGDLTPKS